MRRSILLLALVSAGSASLALAQGGAPMPCGSAVAACLPPQIAPTPKPIAAPLTDAENAMRAHVMFLASDAMQGREAGSHEFDIAAQYVASQFSAAGLKPAGDNGDYLQAVPLVAYKPADDGAFVLTGADGKATKLVPAQDYIVAADPEAATTHVAGDIVFVGQGIVAPDYGRDDYAGVDVTGKIVALVLGAPESFDGEQRAHFGGIATKAAIAKAHGAAGVIVVQAAEGRIPFAQMAGFASRERVTWGKPDGTGHGNDVPALGTLSVDQSKALFAGSGTTLDDAMKALAGDGKAFRPVALKAKLDATLHTEMRAMKSSNVAGLLPGSDPKVGDEVVILSAHLDHIGAGAGCRTDKTGDHICNGAMDNAVGIASLIEEAKQFKASGKAPRRSILFLAVTGEEKGLVGSDYFAQHPTLPKDKLVADVNLDMPILTYKFQDVIVFGAQRSTLGAIVKRAAAAAGAPISPDPMPEQGLFVRSDHYRFVQQGIPSVFLWPGEGGPGKAAVEDFFANHYHQASDSLDQDPVIDWSSGVRFINVNYQIAREIADSPERPRWNKGDFFGTLYHGYGAQ